RLAGRTLAGCRIARQDGRVLVCREAAAVAAAVAARAGVNRWDGRVRWRLPAAAVPAGARIGALGEGGLAQLRARAPQTLESRAAQAIPALARTTLPALFGSAGTLLAVPHLAYRRVKRGTARVLPGNCRILAAQFLAGPLAGARFFGAGSDL
ncbi:MAG: tRNA(Ile)-lysidine synthase, partial [Pseudomonadota bacterium]